MGEVGTSYLFTQLSYQAPALLVYLVATILAIVYMGRATMPCLLTLLSVGILVVATLGVVVAQASLLDSEQAGGRDISELLRIIVIAGSCVRAVGLGILVAAVFVGRSTVAQAASPLP
jgi:hypothetical protein